MKNISDIEIIESVKRGNTADFSILIERYQDRAFTLLKKMLKNEFDAEEALQDSFLKAYNSIDSFREASKFSTWFYRIVYNTALTIISSKKRKIELEMSSIDHSAQLDLLDEYPSPAGGNPAEFLQKVLDRLPVRNSLILILYYYDDLSLAEISSVLGVSLVNAKVMLHRSRNLLRDLVLKHNFQEELYDEIIR